MPAARRILIAEDNIALALVVRLHLEHAGFHAVIARNGKEAWEHLQQAPFDLLVTDQQMPELSGEEVCMRLRNEPRLADLPVIMLTAKGLELEHAQLRMALGVHEVVAKPFSPRELVEKVEQVLAAEPLGG